MRRYDIAAIHVEITLNRYMDYDPEGRMYVLEGDLGRVRAEEAMNRAARSGGTEPGASVGLQGDAIQPLVLRVNQGECLVVALRNDLPDEPVSFHLHGSSLYVDSNGRPALATEPGAVAHPGSTITYRWWVPEEEPEGTHYFHSHGDTRLQTSHGLFGAVVVEPRGSIYLDPRTGAEADSGWDAIIRDPAGTDFREFTLFYHEIGNERYRHRDATGGLVVQVDPLTGAYRPGDRAINYRSEPFMNRLQLQRRLSGRFDESLAYSSYAFGDPATPIARSYLGDPVKQRLVHGGSEVFHVHHVHGGTTRWRRQPDAEPSGFDGGGNKRPDLLPQVSERIDSQAVGPSETFDVETECGSGGCQLGAGDYMIHCHVAHHYFAGMWMVWRVYNTLQDGVASQDPLPALVELPDRKGAVSPAVTSSELLGRTFEANGRSFEIDRDTLRSWVEAQLPPQGEPRGYDASVFDWQRMDTLYLSEPETADRWPGYSSTSPGERRPILFDPRTGKLAYPMLSPHLGRRPPFAPNHGPAPFLDPFGSTHAAGEPAAPGGNGMWSLCPAGTTSKRFVIHAITLPITLNERLRITDPSGQLYVLKEAEDSVRADPRQRVPLAIRANAGEDCVDVVFKSELRDTRENALLSKANIHIHFVQFDVQGSDGVTFGFNYEQSVRPFAIEGEALVSDAPAGASMVRVASTERFSPGALVGVGMDETDTFEVRRIRATDGNALHFDAPLMHDHRAGEVVSSEFVRYRWYPDVQFGTAYFHDHVAALSSWQHGLFGALIAEPPGSRFLDPYTGAEISSGPVADIHTDRRVSADIRGSFRELVLFIQDDNPLTAIGDSAGGSLNLRVEPLAGRSGSPADAFSSVVHGDPETPMIEAYAGDPIVIRSLVAATNDVHTLHVDGHPFRFEPFSALSPMASSILIGISERTDLYLPSAGGPHALPGDYLFRNGRAFKLAEGSWGLIRVHPTSADVDLRPLPDRPASTPLGSTCPEAAPVRRFDVVVKELPLPMLGGEPGLVFALASDVAWSAGDRPVEPLVLHINVGDCLVVELTNQSTQGPVSWHTDRLIEDPQGGRGTAVGRSPARLVDPGESAIYEGYASPEAGEGVALVRDGADPLAHPRRGLYGAVVIGAAGTRYSDPVTGHDASASSSWSVDAHPAVGPSYRDFTLMLHDEDAVIGTAIMPYTEQVAGPVGVNYTAEPLAARRTPGGDPSSLYRSDAHGEPATPLLRAYSGDPLRIHVLVPHGEQAHVFSLEAHRWPLVPGMPGSTLLSSLGIGPLQAITARTRAEVPGDYLYGDHREPYRYAGMWGLLRVFPADVVREDLQPLH